MNNQMEVKVKQKTIDKDIAIILLVFIVINIILFFINWTTELIFVCVEVLWFVAISITHIGAEADKQQTKMFKEYLESKGQGSEVKDA